MNWIKKVLHISEKIKKVIKKRATKEEIASSDWTSCCKGPILKKDLEGNLWVCNSCGKHHRISCRQRFDIFFGKNRYELNIAFPQRYKKTESVKTEKIEGTVAKPSSPSVRFTAFEEEIKTSIQNKSAKIPISKSGCL